MPLAGQVRVGVAIFSYDGALKFGVTGDYDSASDIEVLCAGIERGMAELVEAAGGETSTGRSVAAEDAAAEESVETEAEAAEAETEAEAKSRS